ncbi:MAG TPA: hypothetical protein VFL14_05095 [Xanthomonadales bacterium]|nr:hypothetical protein [Xanthomonadales bacterium]
MHPVARVSYGERWFPDGIGDVVAHTDGRFLAVSVNREIGGRISVVMDEFDCADVEGCLRPISEWLGRIASLDARRADPHVREWADFVATRLVAALGATLAAITTDRQASRLGG